MAFDPSLKIWVKLPVANQENSNFSAPISTAVVRGDRRLRNSSLGSVEMEFFTPLKINGWNIIMEVWKIIFLSKWVICRFHVNFPGCSDFLGPDSNAPRTPRPKLSSSLFDIAGFDV